MTITKRLVSLIVLFSVLNLLISLNQANASSLKGALSNPVPHSVKGDVTTFFGWDSPMSRNHYGLDIAKTGSIPIKASADGIVKYAGFHKNNDGTPGYGYFVAILHNINGQNYITKYGHLKSPPLVTYGNEVNRDQVIGYMGSTGFSTGQHLHFELLEGTTNIWSKSTYAIDPLSYLGEWRTVNGLWTYQYLNNTKHTSWLSYNGKWYFFDSSGIMNTGWYQYENNWYYSYHTDQKNGSPAGSMATGWLDKDGVWYYLNTETNAKGKEGIMLTGWQEVNGDWYYLNPKGNETAKEGAMLTGWQNINDKWYYLNPENNAKGKKGSMLTGWLEVKDKWYYLNSETNAKGKEGEMLTGWQKLDGEWYYLNPQENQAGEMLTGWQGIEGKDFFFDVNGKMAHDTIIDGRTIGSDGAAINQ